jgi:hypothetical protein
MEKFGKGTLVNVALFPLGACMLYPRVTCIEHYPELRSFAANLDLRDTPVFLELQMCGCVSCWPIDDVSQKFPKFVFGSLFDSFGVSPSGELLGLVGDGRYPFLFIKTGWGFAL